ncbi:disulfide oxidoreductase [Paenisporosarcina cavernae]|uniref:Disulfide bond formation protein B n=1 Tax=Paenisporosarcina cavernae TaxID=2320858 RepID=A0A385YUH2_9BACL|nr:disulfide oxidoreductase [Paenisporosarcina cavernae]AYC30204.1 disulfide bond formation protein B [Paenisporosarcina cavernae]
MSSKQENTLLSMWLVALVATIGSLFFSEVKGYVPCELCWYQRILMYPLVLLLGVAYLQKNATIYVTSLVFSIIGASISAYHYGIQKFTFLADSAPACGQVACTSQYINWLGFITIPFLALVGFVLVIVLSIVLMKQAKEVISQ